MRAEHAQPLRTILAEKLRHKIAIRRVQPKIADELSAFLSQAHACKQVRHTVFDRQGRVTIDHWDGHNLSFQTKDEGFNPRHTGSTKASRVASVSMSLAGLETRTRLILDDALGEMC
jgi:hypothetical protein